LSIKYPLGTIFAASLLFLFPYFPETGTILSGDQENPGEGSDLPAAPFCLLFPWRDDGVKGKPPYRVKIVAQREEFASPIPNIKRDGNYFQVFLI
jgi:hypothetical protein